MLETLRAGVYIVQTFVNLVTFQIKKNTSCTVGAVYT